MLSAMCCLVCGPGTVRADEWETNSPYYEDDAWYDVTEWFDGNDYNPTDEAIGRIDNDTFDYDENLTSTDQDNDWNSSYDDVVSDGTYDYDYSNRDYDDYDYSYDDYYDFGYDYDNDYDEYYSYDNDYGYDYSYDAMHDGDYSWYGYDDLYADDDWFYDYYDNGYSYYSDLDDDGLYDYSYSYYDWDNDGYYDAYSTYTDWDSDGFFEDWNYVSLNDTGNSEDKKNQASRQASKRGKLQSISGEVAGTKRVSTKEAKNLLVRITQDGGKELTVDLGPASELDDMDITEGDRISVAGPITKVGDKQLLIAQNLKTNGKSATIDRSRRKFTGTVEGMRQVKGRGQQNQLLVLKSDAGKRRLVDLGAAQKLDINISQGDTVTVRGPATKIDDRAVVLAQTLTHDGNQTSIDRRQRESNSNSN